MRTSIKTAIAAAMVMVGCGMTAQQVASLSTTLATDACSLLSVDVPNAPTVAQVICKVEGQAAPIVVSLPWSAWQAANTPAAKAAMIKARTAKVSK